MNIFSTTPVKISDFITFLDTRPEIPEIPENSLEQCRKGFKFLQDYLKQHAGEPIYGINTGFGSLCQVAVPDTDLEHLQYNLIRSHACGCGPLVRPEIIRLMLALKIRSLNYGHSGVHPDTVKRLHFLLKNNLLPAVYENGSLGASGDLAPLAHLSLPLIGEGEILYNQSIHDTRNIYATHNLVPLQLHAKEGLALLNGTQFMLAHLVWYCLRGQHLFYISNYIAALSGIAFHFKTEPFHPSLHRIRPHKGQSETAMFFHEIFKDSDFSKEPKPQVQDPYSFRCIPQVHGASKDALDHAIKVCEIELNSVTDNPTLFPDEQLILSGGNFHGQPLALAMDFLALAFHELGNISERRTYLLLSGQRGLKPFLAENPGLESGYMILQYTAASLVSYNKTLCFPASADSIISSNGQEDHVSMGANAALKTTKILDRVFQILAIELLTASRALKQKNIQHLPEKLALFYREYLRQIPHENHDHIPHPQIEATAGFLQTYRF